MHRYGCMLHVICSSKQQELMLIGYFAFCRVVLAAQCLRPFSRLTIFLGVFYVSHETPFELQSQMAVNEFVNTIYYTKITSVHFLNRVTFY